MITILAPLLTRLFAVLVAGVLLRSHLPARTRSLIHRVILDVAMPVTFIGMIIPFVKTIPVLVSVLTAGAASLLTLTMPYKLGIVVSAFAGIASGLLAQRIIDARREDQRR